jgi:hypothetical protein
MAKFYIHPWLSYTFLEMKLWVRMCIIESHLKQVAINCSYLYPVAHDEGACFLIHSLTLNMSTWKKQRSWALLAHTCNPNSLGGQDPRDHGLRPDQEVIHKTSSLKWPEQNSAWDVAQQWNAYLVSMKNPWVQTPLPPKKINK